MRTHIWNILVLTGLSLSIACPAVTGQASNRFPVNVDMKYGFIDSAGNVVISPKYSSVGGFHEGLASVVRNDKWGFIDSTGTEVVPPTYSQVTDFSDGVALVMDESGRTGYIDHRLQITMLNCIKPSPTHDFLGGEIAPPFSEGLTEIRSDNKTTYIDRSCTEVITYDGIGNGFAEGLAAVCSNDGKCGYIDHSGVQTIPLKFDAAERFFGGLALVKFADGWGYINRSGRFVVQPQFGSSSREFNEGLAAVEVDGKMGFINVAGEFIIPARYSAAWDFSEEIAGVQLLPVKKVVDGRTENISGYELIFIDHSGAQSIAGNFIPAIPVGFSGGLAAITLWTGIGYINHKGHLVWPRP